MNVGKPMAIARPTGGTPVTTAKVHSLVFLARLVARMSPARIERTMTILAKNAKPATYGDIRQAQDSVLSISAICAGDGCLHRSIAVAALCRLSGTFPEWKTGFQVDPFRAHAWVEAEGRAADHGMDPARWIELITVRAGARP